MTATEITNDEIMARLLDAILPHVPFDGWSQQAFQAAVAEADVTPAVARGLCPRGAVDLALAMHARGDAAMVHRAPVGGSVGAEVPRSRGRGGAVSP